MSKRIKESAVNRPDHDLSPGDVVSGLEPSELVEIQRVAPFGAKTLVEGVGVQSRRVVKRPLTAEELGSLVRIRGQSHTFQGDPKLFLLGSEAERIRIAHQFDPLFAVNSSIVDPLRHQIEAVLTDDPEKVEEERDEVQKLFRLADSLKHHKEAKFAELLSVLDSSDVMRAEEEKLLIFTEHHDTLDSLTKRLEQKGYTVATIHGGMDVDTRKQAQRTFRTRAKIMVATDAAGEGINLQFCRYLINWDIPWNPNRLEQRIRRVHRYGQADGVWV